MNFLKFVFFPKIQKCFIASVRSYCLLMPLGPPLRFEPLCSGVAMLWCIPVCVEDSALHHVDRFDNLQV